MVTLVLYPAPSLAFFWIYQNRGADWIWSISGVAVSFALNALVRGALIKLTAADLAGEDPSLATLGPAALRSFLPLIGVAVVSSAAILAGFVLLLVPGLIAALAFSVAYPAAVVERLGVVGSMRRSWRLTGLRRGSILALLLVSMMIQIVVTLAVDAAFGLPLLQTARSVAGRSFLQLMDPYQGLSWPAFMAQSLTSTISLVIGSVGATVLYLRLRAVTDGARTDELASVFD